MTRTTTTPGDLRAALGMLQVQRAREVRHGRTHILPAIDAAVGAVEAELRAAGHLQALCMTTAQRTAAQREQFAPTVHSGSPVFQPTRLHAGFAPTMAATQIGGAL